MKLFFLSFLMFSFPAWSAKTLSCTYNQFQELEFSLNDFEKSSFQKEFKVKEKSYKIVVKDLKNPTEVEDYLTISSDKYKMTYALDCQVLGNEIAHNQVK